MDHQNIVKNVVIEGLIGNALIFGIVPSGVLTQLEPAKSPIEKRRKEDDEGHVPEKQPEKPQEVRQPTASTNTADTLYTWGWEGN